MFYVPKNAVYRRIDRRRFLELGGGAATALGAGSIAVGLNSVISRTPAYAASSDDAKWKQGFILENVEGEWYVLYHVEEGSTQHDLPWVKKIWKHKQYGWNYDHDPSEGSKYHKAEDYKVEYIPTTMSKDEYAAWRVAVERERLGIA